MLKYAFHFLATCLFAVLLFTCSRPPVYPAEPLITFKSLSKNQIAQSRSGISLTDTIVVKFTFRDGDGDLGSPDSTNIILKDSRDGFENFFKINAIPKLGPGSGIEGEIAIKLSNSAVTRYFCCTYPNTRLTCIPNADFPTNTMYYIIRIRDRAGHWSNDIQTTPITILCQ
jgi:hypothetical protein